MRSAFLALAFALSGCAGVVPAITVAGGGASIWSAVKSADQDADAILAADAPVKRLICADIAPDQRTQPRLWTWCANIPTDVGGLIKQWAAVGVAGAMSDNTPEDHQP